MHFNFTKWKKMEASQQQFGPVGFFAFAHAPIWCLFQNSQVNDMPILSTKCDSMLSSVVFQQHKFIF